MRYATWRESVRFSAATASSSGRSPARPTNRRNRSTAARPAQCRRLRALRSGLACVRRRPTCRHEIGLRLENIQQPDPLIPCTMSRRLPSGIRASWWTIPAVPTRYRFSKLSQRRIRIRAPGNQRHEAAAAHRVVHQLHRLRPADGQRHHRHGEDHGPPQWQHRECIRKYIRERRATLLGIRVLLDS